MQLSRRKTDSANTQRQPSHAALLRAQADAACEALKHTSDPLERRRLDELCLRLHHEAAVLEQRAEEQRAHEQDHAEERPFGSGWFGRRQRQRVYHRDAAQAH